MNSRHQNSLEQKFIEGRITLEEIAGLRLTATQAEDIRVRETARILLRAIDNQPEGEPHVQRLLIRRNSFLFESMIERQT